MTTITFDELGYFEQLKGSGLAEATAKVVVKILHQQAEEQYSVVQKATETQNIAMQKALEEHKRELQTLIEEQRLAAQEALEKYDESLSKKVATKGDLRETELRLQKEIEIVRKEMEVLRSDLIMRIGENKIEIEKVRADLSVAIEKSQNKMIMWMVGVGIALAGMIITLGGIILRMH